MNYIRFLLKFFIGYVLLGSVLFVVDVPNLGMVLSLLAETPVSGYYVLVMRAELISYPQPTRWEQLPVWDARKIGELYWLGFCMNTIMAAYAIAAAALPLMAVGLMYAANTVIGDNFYLHALVNAVCLTLFIFGLVPGFWILFFLQPIAIVRYAQTERFMDAFQFRLLAQLSLRACRFAVIGALIMLAAYVLNIASSLLVPEMIILSEPTIEFAGVVFAFKFIAHSYQKKLMQDGSNE